MVRECTEAEYSSIPVGSAYYVKTEISLKTSNNKFCLLDKVAVWVDFATEFNWAVAMEKLMKK